VILRVPLGSSPEGSFWHLKSRVLAGLAREAQKRETGSIRSEDDLKVDLGGFWAGSWDSGILCFHLNSRFLTLYLNVTFLCKLR